MEWQTHRRRKSTYDANPGETGNFPAGSGWYDICPLSGRVDDWRSYSNPASDHLHKVISLDSVRGTRAGLESRSLEESSAEHGEGGPTARHLASASGLVAESAGRMRVRADSLTDAGRSRSRFPAASAASAVCTAFALPIATAAVGSASRARTVAAAIEGPLRETARLWDGSISALDPVGSVGPVSRT